MNEIHRSGPDAQRLKARYLEVFRRNRGAILDVANQDVDAPIKGCPGWDVAALTGHMGRVYTFWLKWVHERPRGISREAWNELTASRDARLPGYTAWDRAGFPKESRPDGIVTFARDAGNDLDSALAALEPEEVVWTFVPTCQTGAFVFRRLAMETTIHRWDAEDALHIASPIEGALARDGIDEMLMMFREDPAYDISKDRRNGQNILLRENRADDDQALRGRHWLVSFDDSGVITVTSAEGPADVTVGGSAEELWLYIMGRRPAEDMQIEGDRTLAAMWGDLAGRF